MKDPLTIQISNRARLESGIEGGEWLKLPATAEQLHAVMRRVGITADNPQDFLINGIETPIDGVSRLSLGNMNTAGIDELNFLAARLETLDDFQIRKLNAAAEVMAYWDDVHHLAEYTHNTDYFVLIPDAYNHVQLGEYYLDKSGMIEMPEEWIGAINIEMLGQLAAAHEKGQFTEHGYILETGDEWKPVNEVPEQYRIMSYPQPEQQTRPNPDKIDYDAIDTRAPAVATVWLPTPAQPQPVIPLVLNAENPAEKLKEITEKLEQGIAGIFESEQYADYLKTLSKFHNYSLNNTILIAMQKPDASHIAGYTAWKSNFERQVKKGEKGIKILAPSPFKIKKEMEKIDPDTRRPVIGADGKPVTEEKEITIPAFKVVSVFDVSQTEGKELPTIGVDNLTGSVEQYKDFFAALEKASPVPVAFENIESGANGYYHLEDKRIAIREGMSELQTLKTAIHEIAHSRLHDIDVNALKDEQQRVDRRTREVEAESIAYTVCQHYGLDTSDYSFGYVAGWSSNKELAELKSSLETIRTAAAELITEIDGHFTELQKDREQTAEQRPVFESLPPEQQQALSNEVQATLQFFIDSDIKERGEVTESTLEAIAAQGYEYRDGKLEKSDAPQTAATLTPEQETPERFSQDFAQVMDGFYKQHPPFLETVQMANTSPAFVAHSIEVGYTVDLHRALNAMEAHPEYKETADSLRGRLEAIAPIPPEQQPGHEEWSEPATAENAPDNPGVPSDDISEYLPPQDEQPAQATDAPETTVKYYPINEGAARRAKEAISFSDYRPGSATAEYRHYVDEAVQIAERQKARVDPMYHDKIDGLLDTYARKLAENMNNGYSITARVPSVLIAGPSNFPVRQKQKQNAASDRNMQEWRDIQGLLDKIRSTGMGGISADDPNAIKKLQDKLVGLEQSQETMKAVNAYYRKHKTLDGCPDLSTELINRLKADMSRSWRGEHAKPFEAWALSNNNAEIHRVKGRIEELMRRNNTAFAGWQFDGGRVEANGQDNRLQIFFDDKPDADTRAELKSNGFKWAPSAGAWQRQLNSNAYYACDYVKSIQPLTGEKPTELQRKARLDAAQTAKQEQPAPEQQTAAPGQSDNFSIYQLKRDDSTRDFRFEPLERLQAAGIAVDPANYELVYSAPITADTGSLGQIYEKFNIDHPEDFTGHSLSISDIVIIKQEGEETAHYVDSFGFREVPEFLQPAPEKTFDLRHTADYLQGLHENVMNADPNKTMGVAAYNTAIKRLEKLSDTIPDTHPQLIALVNHAAESTDLSMLMQRMTTVHNEFIQPINYLETAEKSTEQNYNMIDGIMNNTPTVAELEAKATAGERINLLDFANAVKAEKPAPTRDAGKKPSIRKQLAEGKAQLAKDKPAPDKAKTHNNDLEV